jgi:transposase-like protein
MNNREIRGYAILAKGVEPKQITIDSYLIPSQSSDSKYLVKHINNGWICDCPDFKFRHLDCKHIHAIKFWLSLKQNIVEKDSFKLIERTESKEVCPFCKSECIIKKGIRKNDYTNKQRFLCKSCNRKFVLDPFKKFKCDGKTITLVMDLYFKGVSLRKIKDHLEQFYYLRIHHETIRRWIVHFTKLMNNYVSKLEPQLSGNWHADEQMIKSKGKWLWSWNVLDEKTRFLIANNITEGREIEDARAVFDKAKRTARVKPKSVTTDGLLSYEQAIKKELLSWRYPQTKHISFAGPSKKENNNLIERYHSTFRERDKVMRGFKGLENAQVLMNGFTTYYNFIRPHTALNGLTPATVAGLGFGNGNRWLNLIKLSMETTANNEIEPKEKFQFKTNKNKFIIRTFKDGIEVNLEKKINTRFKSHDQVIGAIEFYKNFYPDLEFRIEEN